MRDLNCQDIAVHLTDYLDGCLDAALRECVDRHLQACPACQEVFAAMRDNQESLRGTEGEDLTGTILSRTSGPACRRAEELLPELITRELPVGDTELVEIHLEHCRECRAVADTLGWLMPLLPQMGEIRPDRSFTGEVLARTAQRRGWRSRWHEGLQRRAEALERAFGRISQRWLRAWQRPRFAFEAAYCGVLLLVALCATPVSPLREAPPQALAAVQAGPQQLSGLAVNLRELPASGATLASALWTATGGPAVAMVRPLSSDLQRRRTQAAPAWRDLSAEADTLVARLRQGRIPELGVTLGSLVGASAELWQRWWQAETVAPSQPKQNTEQSAGGGMRESAPVARNAISGR